MLEGDHVAGAGGIPAGAAARGAVLGADADGGQAAQHLDGHVRFLRTVSHSSDQTSA